MKRILISAALSGLLFAPLARSADGCCSAAGATDKNASCNDGACAAGEKVALKITGMTCPMCAASVEKALKQVAGVTAAEVSNEKGSAVVTFDPSKTSAAKLVQAVAKAGGTRHQFKADIAADAPQVTSEGQASAKNSAAAPRRPKA